MMKRLASLLAVLLTVTATSAFACPAADKAKDGKADGGQMSTPKKPSI